MFKKMRETNRGRSEVGGIERMRELKNRSKASPPSITNKLKT
jgi:hypothetical protein